MKKFIIAFGAGSGMTFLVMMVGLRLTYTQSLPAFVFAVDAVILVALIVGAVGTMLEQQTEDEEVAPLPKEIEVTNDKVIRTPTTGSNADRSNVGKIKIAFEGEPSPLMAATLKEAEKDA